MSVARRSAGRGRATSRRATPAAAEAAGRRPGTSASGTAARGRAGRWQRPTFWIVLALAGLTVAVFWPVRSFDFVSFDDPSYITENPHVLGGLTSSGLWWAMTSGYLFYWHPVTWLSHMTDVQAFGLFAGGHHATRVLIHLASTLALFLVLFRVTGARWRSALVAGLFAVHPLHVESVAWVAERKDVLSTFFLMLTLWAYAEYVRRPGLRRYAAVLFVFALGLMAKPMLVTLPVVLLLLDVWPFRRWPGAGASPTEARDGTPIEPRRIKDLVAEKVPLLLMAVGCSAATLIVQKQVGAVGDTTLLPIRFRLANAVVSYVEYMRETVWPAGLAVFYPYPPAMPSWPLVLGAVALLAVISFLALKTIRARPYLFVGWGWYLVTLLPVIGLLQAGDQVRADRFTYVPLVGLFLVVAWGLADVAGNRKRVKQLAAAGAAAAVVACAIAARGQVAYWRTSETLWTRALSVTTGNHRAHAAMAALRVGQGRLDEAVAEYREALRIVPGMAQWRNDLGVAYTRQGKFAEALGQYAIAVRVKPDFAEAHNNLGAILARAGKRSEATAEYREALRLKPDYGLAHGNLGLALAEEGQVDQALRECLEAARLEPTNPRWHYLAAVLLRKTGRDERARAELDETLRLDPHFDAARRARDELARGR